MLDQFDRHGVIVIFKTFNALVFLNTKVPVRVFKEASGENRHV
jgi:hypothetical protein